jgi:hypothetical protein
LREKLRSFGRRALAFVALQASLAAVLSPGYLRAVRDPRPYLAAWRDKERLLRETPPPRVVLVGGSNLAFGVDSARLGRELGRHAVNLGLHAGLGEELMLRWAESGLLPGDVVVVSMEYEKFCDARGTNVLINLIELQPEAVRYADKPELARLVLDHGLNLLGRLPRLAAHGPQIAAPYSRASFNALGDVVAHHDMAPRSETVPLIIDACHEADVRRSIGRLNEFARRSRARGATPVYSFPVIPAASFRAARSRLPWLAERIRAGLEMPVVTSPDEMAYGPRAFFDTAYHLTELGSSKRTALLVERLSLIPAVRRSLPSPPP